MKKKSELERILFGYSNLPACGWEGKDDGGFSVEIYEDGRLIYRTYIYDQINRTEMEYKLSYGSVSAIKTLLEKHQKVIDTFDSHLHNGSYDGCENCFIFKGVQVITWNICYINPLFFFLFIFCREKEYLLAAKQENRILSLFFRVTEILKNDGVDINLDAVTFSKGNGC